ncbi:MAG: sugar phosphate isomerase/epimerase family protein [Planctomycetota bacterium]|jgi:sugar phosphate isomerase/epimerase
MHTGSGIILSVSKHCIAGEPSNTEALSIARAEGLDMVEFFGNEYTTRQLHEIRRASSNEGIRVAWHPWLNLAGLKWAREISGCLQEIIEDALRMGARNVVIHLGEAEPAERATTLAAVSEGFRAAGPSAREAGVRFCVENEPSYVPGVLGDAFDDFELLFSSTDAAAVGFTFDAGHALITGGPEEWLDKCRRRLGHVHLHSNDGTDDLHLGYPHGVLDWEGLLRRLLREGFRGPFNIEFDYEDGGRRLCALVRQLAEEHGSR